MIGNRATLGVDVDVDAKGVDSGVDRANGKLGKLGGVARGAGLAVAGGLAIAGAAAVGFAVKAVGSASHVEQAMGALDAVYGKNAAQVKKWADGAATSVGLAKSEYADLSAVIGSQLQGMGIAQDKSAVKSNQLIKLGADLASTYGGTTKDAVEALSSTLKGETDPIERYGVSIKQSDINARLAAQGLTGLTGKAAKQAQAAAVLGLVTEQTSKAHGQFAKQTGTLAEQQQILGAKFENLKATLGDKLLPVATKVVSWASDKLLPATVKLGKSLDKNLGPALKATGRFITTTVVPAARQLYGWFVDKIAPGLKKTLTPVLNGAKAAFGSVKKAVAENRPGLEKLGRAFRDVAEFVAQKILPLMGKTLGKNLRIAGAALGVIIGIVADVATGFGKAKNAVQDLISWIKKIHIPDINIPGLSGHYGIGRVAVGGAAPGYAPRGGLATASSLFDTPGLWNLVGTGGRGGSTTIIDRTDNRLIVQGHVLDVDGLVDLLQKAQRRRARRGVS